jgi:tetratricopeptide (TPR) repeat protein
MDRACQARRLRCHGLDLRGIGIAVATLVLAACSGRPSPERVLASSEIAIAAGEVHELILDAPPDWPLSASVSAEGIDVQVEIQAGEMKSELVDAPNRRMGVETAFLAAPHDRTVRIRIASGDHSGASGVARIHAVALPSTSYSDRRRIEAARLEAEACLHYPDLEQGQSSAEAFLAAARLRARSGDPLQAGLATLHAAGVYYTRLADWQQSAQLAAQAADLLESEGARTHLAYALRLEGAALDQLASTAGGTAGQRERHLRRARERLTESYRLFKALGNDYEAGYALNYRGVSYDTAGEREAARADFLSALQHFRKARDRPAQALSLQSLALQSHQEGRLGDAIREFDEALALTPRDEDPENYAHTLHNSALPLRTIGRFDEAISRFHEAGDLLHTLRDRDGEARALHGLGTTLMHAGEPDRAIEMLQAAIDLRGPAGSRREQATSLMALGESERQLGRLDRAIEHQNSALALAAAPHELAQARLFLARAYVADRQLDPAGDALEAILELALPDTHLYRGLALAELGTVDSLRGRATSAEAYFARAIDVLRIIDSDFERAKALVARAAARLRAGDHDAVLADCGTAIEMLDAIGERALQAESRSAFRASYRLASELEIAALIAKARREESLGHGAVARRLLLAALSASDRDRNLRTAVLPAREGQVPAEDRDDRQSRKYELLAGKRALRDRLLSADAPDAVRIAELTRQIARLRTEANRDPPGETGPALTRGDRRPAGVLTARDSALPGGIMAAEFFVGSEHAWVFEIRADRVAVRSLGSGNEIEEQARALHDVWNHRSGSAAGRVAESRLLAARLFRGMGAPRSGETLYLLPDGPLHIVPMAVLARQAMPTAPEGAFQTGTSFASLLAREERNRPRNMRIAAIVADPIYESDDPRVRGTGPRKVDARPDPFQTRHAERLSSLQRLPATAAEADEILRLAEPLGPALVLTGSDATRAKIQSAGLDQYRIVHFATHALSDARDPGLSTLALSRFDGSGSQLEGDLPAFGIAALNLHADLVVLSACDTALGREIVGEAPLGLARAFLQGGARTVLATLWQVPDTATARLMTEFYRQVLSERRTPAAALELAQRHVRSHARWSDPYYWAGFQLVSVGPANTFDNNVN